MHRPQSAAGRVPDFSAQLVPVQFMQARLWPCHPRLQVPGGELGLACGRCSTSEPCARLASADRPTCPCVLPPPPPPLLRHAVPGPSARQRMRSFFHHPWRPGQLHMRALCAGLWQDSQRRLRQVSLWVACSERRWPGAVLVVLPLLAVPDLSCLCSLRRCKGEGQNGGVCTGFERNSCRCTGWVWVAGGEGG